MRIEVDCEHCGVRLMSLEAEGHFDVSGVRCSKHPDLEPKVTSWDSPEGKES